jgi:prevent-host-death family protein
MTSLTNLVKEVMVGGMTTQVNLYEAKTHLSDLVERAAKGEDIVIAKAGRPRVRLVPVPLRTAPREFGVLRGQVVVAPDFDEPLPEFDEV